MIGWGQISITSLPASYTNNFNNYWPVTSVANSLATIHSTGVGTGLASAATGWAFVNPSGNLNQRGTGTGATAGVIAYGFTPGSEYSLGTFRTSTNEISYTISFVNNSGATINSLTLGWDYEQWRYANASGFNVTGTGVLATNTTLNSKDFAGTASGTNGVSTTTPVPYFVLSGLSIANGAAFGITWLTTDVTGADNGISIDNFYIYAGPTTILAPYTSQLSGNISKGATTEPIAGITVTNSESSDFTGVTVTGLGTAASTDVTNIRVFSDNNGNGLIDGADAAVSTNTFATYTNPMAFSFTSETGFTGSRNYLIVGDISPSALTGNTIVLSIASLAFTTTAANKIGSMASVTRTINTPSVNITSLGPVAGNIGAGVDNNIIYNFSVAVATSGTNVTSITLPSTFTNAGDFKVTGFKLWYSTANLFSAAIQLLPAVDPNNTDLVFTLTTRQSIAAGVTGYFWITADVASGANGGNTITGGALPPANMLFSTSATVSGTPLIGGTQTIVVLPYAAFDNFDRSDNTIVGVPSSGGSTGWTELEQSSDINRAMIVSTRLRLANCVSGSCGTLSEAVTFNMTGKYATTFANAASNLEWYFNMKQSRTGGNLSGFTNGDYGMAFIIGANESDMRSATVDGYAIIMGEVAPPGDATDPIRLVYFTNGIANYTSIISFPSPVTKTNYMSVRVTYNPCTSTWGLLVRDDGASTFTNPITITGTEINAVNSVYTATDLSNLGALWQHNSSSGEYIYFDNIYIPSSAAIGNTYTWNGTTTDYQLSTNWTPSRTCIRVTDVLQFNASSPANSTVINVPVQTIGQLLISNNRNVTMRDVSGDAVASTLTIGGLTGTDFQVEAGSSLTLDVAASNASTDAMLISLGSAATGGIGGTVNFFNSVSGVGRDYRILAATAGSIVVTNTGIVKATDLSGNPFGTTGAKNIITFNSGAIYEFNDGGNPFGFAQPDSKVIFNSGSIYKHKYAPTPPSLAGRTYGDFEFDVTSGTSTVASGSASPVVCTMDNLKVISGTLLINCSFNSLPVNINLKKDLLVSAGASFSYDPTTSTAASTISFNAATIQQLINVAPTGAVTFGRYSTVKLDNSFATVPQLTVQSNIDINGALDITQGTIDLAPGNITLKSTATYTARVAPVTGSISYGTGKFIIERYLPIPLTAAARRWRLLTAPIKTTGAPNINSAWQEGVSNADRLGIAPPLSDPYPGFGTIITRSTTAANGYDQGSTNNPSIFKFDGSLATQWQTIAATNAGAITDQEGYMIFVRGNRNFYVAGPGVVGSPTTLRTTGLINTGNISKALDQLYPKLIGNPYASAISFNKVLVNGQSPATTAGITFYLWDPKYAGLSNVGGLIQFTSLGTGFYTVAPTAVGSGFTTGTYDGTIESGAAFIVPPSVVVANIDFTEASKIQTSSTQGIASRPSTPQAPIQKTAFFTTNLLAGNGVEAVIVDGVVNVCRDDFDNKADEKDGPKLITFQTAEKLSIIRDDKLIGIELRKSFEHNDSIVYQLSKLKQADYQLAFIQTGFTNDLKAIAVDKFTGKKMLLSSTDTSLLPFTITDNPASAAADRFKVVFKSAIKFNAIAATIMNANVQLNWKLENEFDADRYEVERSLDAISFTMVANVVSTGNSIDAVAYSALDLNPAPGIYYYRIKASTTTGAVAYSDVVKVKMMSTHSPMYVYPNPVSNGNIGLQFNSQAAGKYAVRLLNTIGQMVVSKQLIHPGGTAAHSIAYPAALAGNYQLEVTAPGKKKTIVTVMLQ